MEVGIAARGDAHTALTLRRAVWNLALMSMIAAVLVTVRLTCILMKMISRLTAPDHAFAVYALHIRDVGQSGTIDDIRRIHASARMGGVLRTRLGV